MENAIHKQSNRQGMGNYRTSVAEEKKNQTAQVE